MSGTLQFLVPLGSCFGLSAGVSFCLSRWSGRLHLMAQPRPDRWHLKPTPNTGGLGILLACACCGFLLLTRSDWTIAICSASIAILGLVDDRLELRPLIKFAGQSIAAMVLIGSGVVVHLTPSRGTNLAFTYLWLVGITNAFNLIDNMDGLCAGVAIIAATSEAALALLQHDSGRAALLMVLAAGCAGFLMFNYKPARIFLGDGGSLFLGFSLASLAIAGPAQFTNQPAYQMLAPLPAFLYPIFDTTLVTVTRRRAGQPISVGGRDHSSHRLVSMGLTERGAVWVLWGCAALCGLLGPLTYGSGAWFTAATASLAAALVIFATFLARLPEFAAAPSYSARNIRVPGVIAIKESRSGNFSMLLQRQGQSRQ